MDRTLKEGETFTWEGNSFTVFHIHGHTWWALGMFGEVDGTRITFTGDNPIAGTISPLGPPRRSTEQDAGGQHREGGRAPTRARAAVAADGPHGAIEVNKQILDDFIGWARDLSDAFVKAVAVPDEVNFALDPNWCTLFPYQSKIKAGSRLLLELRATDHAPKEEFLRASMALPPGWTATPDEGEVSIYPGQEQRDARSPSTCPQHHGRHILCPDVTLGARRSGWVTEAIVDIV